MKEYVVCMKDVKWDVGCGPKKDDICTVSECGRNILFLSEYTPFWYKAEFFRPIDMDLGYVIAEIIEREVKETVEILQ